MHYILALDDSGSMTRWSRWDNLMKAVGDFLKLKVAE
jgi:hypothetical protein